ncbi:unnamed protein product [Rotaria socialis]|uniref:Uncharacterized protein n=1 Tax=Rotaria socialis TaxID=392032 RepID=A0A817N1E5_9BILA|nr:unnamed protein product [Rotaria socialis]CAF4232579.1 unnamed protein product [Rotaria socialis]
MKIQQHSLSIIKAHAEINLSADEYLSDQPLSSEEKKYYDECKQYYYMTKRPLISVSDEIFDHNVAIESLILKFGIDEDCHQFKLQNFLNNICSMLNITMHDISIKNIQNGSAILETEIFGKLESKDKALKIRVMYESLTDKMQEEIAKLNVFFLYMGSIEAFAKQQNYRSEIKLNPQFNRTYGPGHTYWTGELKDGRDRGGKPYYCPVGWQRNSLYIIDNLRARYKGWCICYHGTKFSFGLAILLSGLKPADNTAHGEGIYASPSIIYACHPRYAEVKDIEPKHQNEYFKIGKDQYGNDKYGKYVQFVLECRVHPSNIKKIGRETLGVRTTIDSNVSNEEIEWVIKTNAKKIVDFNDVDAEMICTGIMIRVTEQHPQSLPDSKWWSG